MQLLGFDQNKFYIHFNCDSYRKINIGVVWLTMSMTDWWFVKIYPIWLLNDTNIMRTVVDTIKHITNDMFLYIFAFSGFDAPRLDPIVDDTEKDMPNGIIKSREPIFEKTIDAPCSEVPINPAIIDISWKHQNSSNNKSNEGPPKCMYSTRPVNESLFIQCHEFSFTIDLL